MELKLLNSWIILLLFSLSSVCLNAQKTSSTTELAKGFFASEDSIEKDQSKIVKSPQQTQESLVTAENPLYNSIKFDRELKQYDFTAMHQQRSFAWQFYSGICIFIMVVFIVAMGLVLSYKQFKLTEIQVKANISKPKSETTVIESEETNIEISQTGLKINTGVIGLAILFLSLAFFFLYLKYVYPIDIIDVGD
ncbi:hypothetical protein [Flavobacterium granuli]|uniref:Cytochrome c-type biogenesis protein CcmH/NrfG n=1 Tax=Flavobacterium granuli TaxID=280093 RepID=A0ABU1RZP2_9FLAO|nr:hypothetical protein [Flavobacterium granuli]MDR6844251.1 cytochrome c-type biogenesis protein CcmH/NrfG [Flavobacterium granuli]